MAQNPSIYNAGGIQRFIDYVSQIPDFLKAEDDVVILLQVLSDYLNNAYRNISVVEKFEFKFVAIESNLAKIQKKTAELVNLLKQSELRDSSMLFLSKPQGNPYIPSRPFIVEYIKYNGNLESISEQEGVLSYDIISAAIRNSPNSLFNGDKFFVKFTNDDYSKYSAVYYYDSGSKKLIIDPYTTSQDPFTNTINEPIQSIVGLVPRIITFKSSNISEIYTRKAETINGLDYYNVYFTATISNIKNISSVFSTDEDIDNDGSKEKILIDYYNIIKTLPSVYDQDISLTFGAGCDNFEWTYGYGKGLFYARELTNTNILTDKSMNSYIDPYYDANTTILDIIDIVNLGGNSATVTVNSKHNLIVGDYIFISGTELFNKSNAQVVSVINSKKFTFKSNTIGHEYSGKIITTNLNYSKLVDSGNYKLKIDYNNKCGNDTINSGDLLYRINTEYKLVSANTYASTDMNISTQSFAIDNADGFERDSYVMVTIPSNTTTPLNEHVHYKIVDLIPTSDGRQSIKLAGVNFTTPGVNNITNDPIVFTKINKICDESTFNVNTQEFILNDITGLESGDYIKIISLYGQSSTLLASDCVYTIESVNLSTNGIKLHETRFLTVPITSLIFGIVKLNIDYKSHGKIFSHNTQGTTGTILFGGVYGDMISSGMFIKYNTATYFPSVILSASTTTVWESSKIYYKNQYVYHNGYRYRILKTHTSGSIDTRNSKYYSIDMDDIVVHDKKPIYNPYMNGMYSTKSLDYGKSPDYTIGFDKLYSDLYITKTEDLSLKFGYEQRQFVFNPRISPSNILRRNGFMEIIHSDINDYDAVDGTILQYVKARTLDSMLLKGADWKLELNIDRISMENGLVTVATTQLHQLKTGVYITISNLNESVFNGRYKITVITPYAFTYFVSDLSTQSGTYNIPPIAVYNNDIRCGIASIIRLGTIATVTTAVPHGYSNGITVTIEGADQSAYNITTTISVDDAYTFTYIVDGSVSTPATSTTEIISIYTPNVNDFISVENQYNSSENGIYVISNVGDWDKIDTSKVSVPLTLFAKQNLFDTSNINQNTCLELNQHNIESLVCDTNSIATVTLYDTHSYIEGTVVVVSGASQGIYNGKYEVIDTPTPKSFRYKLKGGSIPVPATPQKGLDLLCQSEQWYKYEISAIEWQQKSSYNSSYIGHTIAQISGNGSKITINTDINTNFVAGDIITISNTENYNGTFTIHEVINANTITIIGAILTTEFGGNVYKGISIEPNSYKDNINVLYGEYKFKLYNGDYYTFKSGDIIELNDQFISYENGIYRVQSDANWTRLDKKLVMKISDITVDARENDNYDDLDEDAIPYVYVRYTDSEVNSYIHENFSVDNQIYKIYGRYATNYNFQYEKIDNLDTSSQLYQQYNSRFDYNSIAPRTDMSSDFIGVTDLTYPLAEKFERLAYLKDPKVIDIELIEYLARFMGYDISQLRSDLDESIVYSTKEERDNALRETIQNLPQYYTLKGTESSLELLLATFGIVGKLVTYWTRAENPYDELIPDYELKGTQLIDNLDGKQSNFVVTPHFKLKVEIEGNFDNELLASDNRRITNQIRVFKPINTVFDGIYKFLDAKAKSYITISNMRSVGKLTASVGFDPVVFDEDIANDCFDGSSWNIQSDYDITEDPYLVSITPQNKTLTAGETFTITPTFSDGGSYACNWSSNNTTIATVNSNGVVTVLNPSESGSVIISCTYNGITKVCYGNISVILPFIIEVNIPTNSYAVTLNSNRSGATVDWGDGVTDVIMTSNPISHTYTTLGVYTVTINKYIFYNKYYPVTLFTSNSIIQRIISYGTIFSYKDVQCLFDNSNNLTSIPLTYQGLEHVEYTYCMFRNCTKLKSIPATWEHLDNVTDVGGMFYGCTGLTSIPTTWEHLDNVDITNGMFMYCTSLISIPDSWLYLDNVTDAGGMFHGCNKVTSIPATWEHLDNLTNAFEMFRYCGFTSIPVTWLHLDNVTNTSGMFYGCSELTSIPTTWEHLDNVTNTNHMFIDCVGLTSIPATWEHLDNVTNAYRMFRGCTGLTSIPATWEHLDNLTNASEMFRDCNLTSIPTTWLYLNNVINTSGMFYECTGLTSIPTTWEYLDNVTNTSGMFYNCKLTAIPATWLHLDNVANTSGMFYGCTGLTSIPITWEHLDNVTNTSEMFRDCNLTSIPTTWLHLDNVTNTSGMFYNCKLTAIPATWEHLTNVTNTSEMFYGCRLLASIPSTFEHLSNVTNASGMFRYCAFDTLPSFTELINLTDASYMFGGCDNITTISNWTGLDNVTDTSAMFYNCDNLVSIPTTWTTLSKVTNMSWMFKDCYKLLNVGSDGYDILANVTNVDEMFAGSRQYMTITDNIEPLYTYLSSKPITVINHTDMFAGCDNAPGYANIPADWK